MGPSSSTGPAARAFRTSWGTGVFEGEEVLFFDLRRRMGYAVGERAVVGEDQEPRRLGVEAARGDEARDVGHEVRDRGAVLVRLVLEGGEVAGRFVQGQVGMGGGQADGAAVKRDLLVPGYGEAQRGGTAVHGNAA
jgi:hypothetical protein